jgi:hypothetical protein
MPDEDPVMDTDEAPNLNVVVLIEVLLRFGQLPFAVGLSSIYPGGTPPADASMPINRTTLLQ